MFQQVTLIGNVGGDPELRYTPDGKAVCKFSVAVNPRKDVVIWHRVTCWDSDAERAAEFLSMGKRVFVIGEAVAHAYTDKAGKLRASLDVTARLFRAIDGKTQGGQLGDGADSLGFSVDMPF